MAANDTPPEPRQRWRRPLRIAVISVCGSALLFIGLCAASAFWLDTEAGRAWIARQLAGVETDSGFSVRIGGFKGSLYGSLTARNVTLHDTRGEWAAIPSVSLRWAPWDLMYRSLSISRVHAPSFVMSRRPVFRPVSSDGPLLPDAHIRIGRLTIDQLILEEAAAGQRFVLDLDGQLRLDGHSADTNIKLTSENTDDRLEIKALIQPEKDLFDLDARVMAPAGGAIAGYLKSDHGFSFKAQGDGSWSQWNGSIDASLGEVPLFSISLTANSGQFKASGSVFPAPGLAPTLRQLVHGPAQVALTAKVKDRQVDGDLSVRSRAIDISGRTRFDMDSGRLSEAVATARLLDPSILPSGIKIENALIQLSASGQVYEPQVKTTARAARLTIGRTAYENVHIDALSTSAIIGGKRIYNIPLDARVSRVTGLGRLLDRRLAGSQLKGTLILDPAERTVRMPDSLFNAQDVSARLAGFVDFDTRRYQLGADAEIQNLAFPNILRASLMTKLALTGSGFDRGPQIRGTVFSRRIDPLQSTASSILGPNGHIQAALELSPQGNIALRNVRLTGRAISLQGQLSLGPRQSLVGRLDGTASFFNGPNPATDPRRQAHIAAAVNGTLAQPLFKLSVQQNEALISTYRLSDIILTAQASREKAHVTASANSTLGPIQALSDLSFQRGVGLENLNVKLGNISLTGSAAQLPGGAVQGNMQFTGGGLNGRVVLSGMPGTSLAADVDMRGRDVQLGQPPNKVQVGQLSAKGQLTFAPEQPIFAGRITIERAIFGQLRLDQLALTGTRFGAGTRLALNARGRRGAPFDFDGAAEMLPGLVRLSGAGRFAGETIKLTKPAEIAFDPTGGWQLRPTEVALASGTLNVVAARKNSQQYLNIKANQISASLLDLLRPGLGIDGQLSGAVTLSRTDQSLPSGEAEIVVRNLRRAGLVGRSQPVDLRFTASVAGTSAQGKMVAQESGRNVGSLDFQLGALAYEPNGLMPSNWRVAPLSGAVLWNGRVDPLWALTGIETDEVSGPAVINAQLSGTVGSPDISGRVRSTNASYENLTTGLRVSKIQVEAAFNGPRLEISRIHGDAGREGRITATGWVDLSAQRRFPADFRARVEKAAVMQRDDIRAWSTGDVRLTHGPDGGLLEGKLDITQARLTMGGTTSANPVPRIVYEEVGTEVLPDTSQTRRVAAKPFRLDLQLRAPDQIFLEGMGLHSEWRGNLNLDGTALGPQVTGRLDLVRGTYEFSGREFRLDRGQIIFRGENPPDPLLDITATHAIDGTTIQIKIGGTAKRPEVVFTSTPQLPQEEILARLLFGESVPNLSATEAVQLGAALTTLRGGNGNLNIVGRVGKAVGIDRLRVLPGDREKGIGTTVSGGKYITDRIYVEVATDGRGYTATLVEVDLTRTLSILSQVATLGSTNVSLKWSKDY